LVVKSGCDFRDLSEITLELSSTPGGNVRNKVISKITGKRYEIIPGMRSSKPFADLLKTLLSSIGETLRVPLCKADVVLDTRSMYLRAQEVLLLPFPMTGRLKSYLQSPICDWFLDIIRHAYDDSPYLKECGGSDGAIASAGTFRGDSVYGPGYHCTKHYFYHD